MPHPQQRRVTAPVVLVAALLVLVAGSVALQRTGERSVAAPRVPPTTSTPTTAVPRTTSTTVTSTTTTSTPPTTAAAVPTPEPAPPPPEPPRSAAFEGKGMWIWQPQYAEEGDVTTIVTRAKATGLTHLFVRTGSSVDGPQNGDFLEALLPIAHANGLKVIGWDFPYLEAPWWDAVRALQEVSFTASTGDHLDGFSADIETWYEGVNLTNETANDYGVFLRELIGPNIPLIATVPRPSPARQADYPYWDVIKLFDAVAPMVYWIDAPPDGSAVEAIDYLSQFGKPVMPVGQAYDGGLEGGPPGTPTYDELSSFINAANGDGAAGVSFWSWQHASDEMWAAIAAGPEVGRKGG